MPARTQSSLDVIEGLVRIVSAERFSRKPRSGSNAHVVVMEEVGGSERHYTTLRSHQDKLSIGEQLWGRYACYIVDRSEHSMRIEEELPTKDELTEVHATMDVSYRAVDGERLVLGVADALTALRTELVSALRAELRLLSVDAVDERKLEAKVLQHGVAARPSWGLEVTKARLSVGWSKEALAKARRLRAEDHDRAREQHLEIDDIKQIKRVLAELGIAGNRPEFSVKLMAMDRKEAWQEVFGMLEDYRDKEAQYVFQQLGQDHELIKYFIDNKILEDMDLQEFGKKLLSQYADPSKASAAFGISLGIGASDAGAIGSGEAPAGELAAPDDSRASEDSEPVEDASED